MWEVILSTLKKVIFWVLDGCINFFLEIISVIFDFIMSILPSGLEDGILGFFEYLAYANEFLPITFIFTVTITYLTFKFILISTRLILKAIPMIW